MNMKLLALWMPVLIAGLSGGVARADNAALAAELVKVFDAHNAAVKAKGVDKALALRSSAFKRAKRFDKKPDAMTSQMYLAYVASLTPQSYEVEYAAPEGEGKATLGLVTKVPGDDGKIVARIVNYAFAKEGGAWKLGEHMYWLVDVDGMKYPKNVKFEPKSAYTQSWQRSGRIIKTAFNADHTLVTLREGDKDAAVFLPPKAALAQMKLKPEDLEAGNKAQFSGAVQKQDELKMWATSGEKQD